MSCESSVSIADAKPIPVRHRMAGGDRGLRAGFNRRREANPRATDERLEGCPTLVRFNRRREANPRATHFRRSALGALAVSIADAKPIPVRLEFLKQQRMQLQMFQSQTRSQSPCDGGCLDWLCGLLRFEIGEAEALSLDEDANCRFQSEVYTFECGDEKAWGAQWDICLSYARQRA